MFIIGGIKGYDDFDDWNLMNYKNGAVEMGDRKNVKVTVTDLWEAPNTIYLS